MTLNAGVDTAARAGLGLRVVGEALVGQLHDVPASCC